MKLNGQEESSIILGVRSSDVQTSTVDESGAKKHRDDVGSEFLCPKSTQVIVGRMHLGDENGKTTYKYGAISFLNDDNNEYEFKLSDVMYSDYFQENSSAFNCEDHYLEGTLIVGREHIGDEKGKTRYAYKKLYAKAKKDKEWTLCKLNSTMKAECTTKESSGLWAEKLVTVERDSNDSEPEKTYYAPMYGRKHSGDENGETITYFACMEL